jgi:itaconyl-CoA hydratase
MAKGVPFEEFEVGAVFDHHWGRTLTAADNVLFSTALCNWNPMYLNVEFARAHGHPDVVINPMLVLCTVVGLSVEDLSEMGGAFLGIDKSVFHHSLYPGDTLRARSTVLDRRDSTSRPSLGIVTWHSEAFDQQDRRVMSYERTNLVLKRDPAHA